MSQSPATDIDPITFAVIKSALDAIVDEMAFSVISTARSEIVKDVMDFSTCICGADGQMLAQAKTIALHLGAVPVAMSHVLQRYGDDLTPGDVIVLNDPYEGGMHLPDLFMFKPIFLGDALEGFAVAICHHTDVGGRVPGSNASDSTEIYQEGLRLPAVKLYERGEQNDMLFRIIEKNVRVPDIVRGDIEAQFAACRVGEREFLKLLQRYGREVSHGYLAALLDYAERLTREQIAKWPDGTYRFTDYIDDDGFSDEPIPIAVAITVHGDGLTVDYEDSSPQVTGALNSTLSYTQSCTYLSVRCVLQADIPNNAGVFRAIDVRAPEGSILNPRLPAACAARALTGYRVVDAMFGALAKIVPDRVPAAGEGGNTVVCIGGYRTDNAPFIIVDMLCGAWGGRFDRDGVDAVTNPSQNMSNTPVEVLEAEHPVRIESYELLPDSCGAGEFRGGLGIAREYRLLASEAGLQLRADRMRFRPYGLSGGSSARAARNLMRPAGTSDVEILASKVTRRIAHGDVIRHEQPGGGGFGDPFERDPQRVLQDVLDEKITPEFAAREHGVVVDVMAGCVDIAATAALREQRRGAPQS
ncbi:MAG: hydantoinase B/oxoprolinase family protein [Alphaproteobacteria bacterium]